MDSPGVIHTTDHAACFQDHNINVFDWHSPSPDLNPIENIWGLLVKRIKAQRVVFQNRQ